MSDNVVVKPGAIIKVAPDLYEKGPAMKHSPVVLIVLAMFLCHTGLARSGDSLFTVEGIFGSGRFAMKTLSSVQWVDGKRFSYLDTDSVTRQRGLYTYRVSDGSRELVMDGALLIASPGSQPMRIGSYQWSADGKHVLVTGTLPARRVKTGGSFGVYDVESKSFRMMTEAAQEQAIIKFSPDARMIGFVRANNLFVVDVATGAETQLTFDGSDDVINGAFDWVYEEEFSIIDGYQWSPDGRYIAFWRLDQSRVSTFPLVRYPADSAYAAVQYMKYPKAGQPNSLVSIGVVDVRSGATQRVNLGENDDIYVPRIQWTANPEVLSIQRLNRKQDTLDLLFFNIADGTVTHTLRESGGAWVDVHDDLRFLKRSDQFLWTSSRDGFNHIYLYTNDGTVVRQLTRGEWEVTAIVGVNETLRLVYFMGTEASPLERHLYSVRFDGTGLRRLSREAGWHSAQFSPDQMVYIDTYSSINTPPNIVLRSNDGTRVAHLIRNSTDILSGYSLGTHQFFSFKTVNGETLNASMIRPADFDSTKRYPVLMYVYGGPGSQGVMNVWGGSRYLWHQMLTQRGYVVVIVDNRGTGGRGRAFTQQTYRRLGLLETEDFIEAAKYLSSLSFIDGSRIGIWGWSGGGYMTCMAMTLGAEYFKTGIAVAPVADFKFYDTIWTERYMSTPADNPGGYKETSPVTHASKMKGNLLLIHGTMDDNVHWQNAIVFVDELVRENKQVETMFYPGRAHSIGGASVHLYTLMTKYILERL